MQQMLVDPVRALGPPGLPLVQPPQMWRCCPGTQSPESSHQMEDQDKREKQLQKLKAQVTPLCCPLTHPRTPSRLSQAQTSRPWSSLPCLATPALVPTGGSVKSPRGLH